MTGAEHFAEAEKLADKSSVRIGGQDWERAWGAGMIALAQVHATLALAAATEKATAFAHGIDTAGYGR